MEPSKIAVRTTRGIELVHLDDILYCIARGRYSKLILINGKEYLLARVLKEIEEVLPTDDFFRTHKSFIINLNHVINYYCNHKFPITLQNNVKIQLAKRRTHAFQKRIEQMAPAL